MVSLQVAALAVVLSASGEVTLLDFYAPWCAPCRAMDGTIAELKQAGYPVRKVNIDQQPGLARQFRVQGVPCFVLVSGGREVGRITGATSRGELEAMFARAGASPATSGRTTTRAQSPDPPPAATVPAASAPPTQSLGNPLASQTFGGPAASNPTPQAAGSSAVADEDLIAASVRLKISDPNGYSNGSGTVIDARQGEALVLTCGHIFRDSQGKGEVTVDFCTPGGPKQLTGRVVSYDLESDVALVSVRPGVPVRFAPLAPQGHAIAKGDAVVSVGCNNGGPATAERSTITAVNKFRGPRNLSVSGLPVQGRSGGGLFTADGRVIGVCNAADPQDHEGLYAALAEIQAELDEVGLTAIYQNPAAGAATIASRGAGAQPPQSVPAGTAGGPRIVPASTVSPASQAAALAGRVPDGAEVICIIRSLANPNAKSEVVLLDRASPDFLRQLAADRQAQEARHLTGMKVRTQWRPDTSQAR